MTYNKYITSTIGLKYNLIQNAAHSDKIFIKHIEKTADYVGDPYNYDNDPKAGKTTQMGL